jgi:hypothetical protein
MSAAVISGIFLCPRCEAEVLSIKTAFSCPNCGLPLGRQPVAPYTPPYTLFEQHEKYQDKEAFVNVVINLPIEKANSMLNDALAVIELIAGKINSTSDIRIVMGLARKIGDIANAYHTYLEVGGKHVPNFFNKQQNQNEEQNNVNTEENGAGQDSSTSPAVFT